VRNVELLHWAARHNIPGQALAELASFMPTDPQPSPTAKGSEASVVAARRLAASKRGARAWRNNVGAYADERGNHIRYGLANDSAQQNKRIKSADLIGVEPLVITAGMVGCTVGRFFAEECKRVGWKRRAGDAHEDAQAAFLDLVNALGGRGEFKSES
jgi:hypothetical protein